MFLIALVSSLTLSRLAIAAQPTEIAATSVPSPAVEFGANTVTITRIIPGSRVAVFAVGLIPNGYESAVMRWAQVLSDDDRDGVIRYDIGRSVPWKSIWIVVALPNRLYTIAAPPGFPVRTISASRNRFGRGAGGSVDLFAHAGSFADLLYVAPAGRCSTIEARDGYDSDTDHRVDGSTSVALSNFRPLEGEGKEVAFLSGGLLFGIDFTRMEVLTIPIDAKMLSEAR